MQTGARSVSRENTTRARDPEKATVPALRTLPSRPAFRGRRSLGKRGHAGLFCVFLSHVKVGVFMRARTCTSALFTAPPLCAHCLLIKGTGFSLSGTSRFLFIHTLPGVSPGVIINGGKNEKTSFFNSLRDPQGFANNMPMLSGGILGVESFIQLKALKGVYVF